MHIYIYYIHLLVLVPCNMVRLDRSVFSIVVGDVKKPWGFRFPLPLGWVDHLYNGAFGPQNVKKIDLAPPTL
jgi:hypothetical protein